MASQLPILNSPSQWKLMKTTSQCATDKTKSISDYYTPDYATEYVIPFLKEAGFTTVWESCCGKGHMVRTLRENGFHVLSTDIWMGEEYDFYHYEPSLPYDAIVTNPPFQGKTKVLERLFGLGKPFAVLLPLVALDSNPIRQLLKQHDGEWGILAPNKTINYITQDKSRKSRSFFFSAWFCYKVPTVKGLVFM